MKVLEICGVQDVKPLLKRMPSCTKGREEIKRSRSGETGEVEEKAKEESSIIDETKATHSWVLYWRFYSFSRH